MRAMILAAGYGKRMRPLTDTCPKPLLTVAGKPLIEYHIEHLVNQGIRDLVINVSWLGEQIIQALGDGTRWGCQIEYSTEATPLETAGGIRQALPRLCPANGADADAPFLVINGDVFTDFTMAQLPVLAKNDLAHLVLVPNPAHNPAGDFGLDGGRVTHAAETRYTFAGISLLRPALLADLPPGPAPLAPLLREAIAQGRVSGQLHQGLWSDVGTPERLDQLNSPQAPTN